MLSALFRNLMSARKARLLVGGFLLTALGAFAGVQYADAASGPHPANQLPGWLAAVTSTGQRGPATAAQLTNSPQYRAARSSVSAQLATGAVTTVSCGQVIKASVTLTGSLACPGNTIGLTLSGTSVTLNFNGHFLYATGTYSAGTGGIGVLVNGTSDTLEKGTVQGFGSAAIEVSGTYLALASKDTVTSMLVSLSPTDGILVTEANGATVSNSTAVYNAQAGIFDQGTGTTLTGNHTSGNYTGFDEEGYNSILKANSATNNGAAATPNGYYSAGFFVTGNATLIGNIATYNYFYGIDNYDGSANDGGGNLAHGNDFYPTTNPTNYPIECRGITCS